MNYFYLIRHSLPEKDTTIPANQWRLSHQGREACKTLAESLSQSDLTLLISSIEPKAIETAQIIAKKLNIPSQIAFGLQEHDRSNIGFIPTEKQNNEKIKEMMETPKEGVFGLESADQARIRFQSSVEKILLEFQDEKIAIISHGTVMSLFIAKENNIEAFPYWQSMQMPAIVKLSVSGFKIIN